MIGKYSGNLEVRFSTNETVRTFATAHLRQLLISHRPKPSARRSMNLKDC